MPVKTKAEATDKRTLAERQRDARATPERTSGPDPPDDLDSDLTLTGRAEDGLIPEGAAERIAEIRDGKWTRPSR